MHMPRTVILGGLVSAVVFGGCSTDTKKQNALLLKENEELRQQLGDRNTALAESQEELRERNMQVAQLRRDGESHPGGGTTGFEQIPDVKATYGSGELTVAVESDILFASGKTALKPAAKTSLDSVAAVLNKSYAEHLIRIEGHTDTDPIRKSGYPSNYHLGFERAFAVREYLISKGIDAKRLSLASYGPDQPLSSKPESRRVEIVVMMN